MLEAFSPILFLVFKVLLPQCSHNSTIYNSKTWKQPKCPPTEEWLKKMWCIHTLECYSAIKKNEAMPCAAIWMDSEITKRSEVKSEKDKHHIICRIHPPN